MIIGDLFFQELNLNEIIKNLLLLPEQIRPVYFAEDEGKIKSKKDRILDKERFDNFCKNHPAGFFLYSEDRNAINISISKSDYSKIDLYLNDKSTDLINDFLKSLSSEKPTFGFACEWDEYLHRNRHYVTLGSNHIESWIGRKIDKYVPGLYWQVLLSDELIEKHKVNIQHLVSKAVKYEVLGNGTLHWLKFFDAHDEWQKNVNWLDDLCEENSGIFSRRRVDPLASKAKDYNELSDILWDWK